MCNPFGKKGFDPTKTAGCVEEDNIKALLCHAKLWVFADYYQIKDLEKLAMSKLGESLLLLSDAARAADVVSCSGTDMPNRTCQRH
jgi:hypothetical protein